MTVAACFVASDPFRFTVGEPGTTINTAATLQRTHGRPVAMRLMKPMLSSVASCCSSPTRTSMPASRRRSKPVPLTAGSDHRSHDAATPAPINASVQGGVLPK